MCCEVDHTRCWLIKNLEVKRLVNLKNNTSQLQACGTAF